ncbi:unnamed protein product, partial [Oikopleura dioica]
SFSSRLKVKSSCTIFPNHRNKKSLTATWIRKSRFETLFCLLMDLFPIPRKYWNFAQETRRKIVYLRLVDGVAKNTRGQSIYVNLNDRMTQKVLQLARYTTEPVLVLIDVNFPSLPPQCVPSGPGIKGDEVYIYEETRLFFRIKKINEGFLKKYEGQNIRVEMTFKIGDQDAEYIHEFPISPVQSNENTSLMSYWAKQEIQKLEVLRRSIGFQGEHAEVKDRIIELSKEGNILHAYTAFIGVSERGNAPKAGSDPSASFHLTNSALETLHNYSG